MRVGFVDQDKLLRNLKNLGFYPKTIFDVGVAKGTPWLYDAYPDSFFYLIEPVASFNSDIAQILKKVKGQHIPLAVGEKPGKAELYIPLDEGKHQISTLCFNPNSIPLETQTSIDVTTLDSLDNDIDGFTNQPILLKTDCQGHDLHVAYGAIQILNKIDVVITEIPIYGPWGGGAELKDYMDFYYANNFILYDMVEPLRRPGDDRLHSIDLCFVNLNSPIGTRGLYTDGNNTLEKSKKHYMSSL